MKKILAMLFAVSMLTCTFASCGDVDADDSGRGSKKSAMADAGDGGESGEDEGAGEDAEATGETEEETTRHRRHSGDGSGEEETTEAEEDTTEAVEETTEAEEEEGSTEEETVEETTRFDYTSGGMFKVGDEDDADAEYDVPKPNDNARNYIMWLDISKDKDYYFEDAFVTLRFRANDTMSNAQTSISYDVDLSNISGRSVKSTVFPSAVGINGTSEDVSTDEFDSGLVFYGTNAAPAPGEEFTVDLCCKNNPGLAAFLIWIEYDPDVLTFISAEPAGEFAKIAPELSAN